MMLACLASTSAIASGIKPEFNWSRDTDADCSDRVFGLELIARSRRAEGDKAIAATEAARRPKLRREIFLARPAVDTSRGEDLFSASDMGCTLMLLFAQSR